MSPNNSAEFWRGAKWMALECSEPLAASKMSMLLAEAEAREAGELSKREWIAQYGGQEVLDREGFDVVPCVGCTDSVCHGWRVRLKTECPAPEVIPGTPQPTAAEVIAKLREAASDYRQAQRRMRDKWAESDQDGKNFLWRALHACEEKASAAIAIAAEWEGRG